MYTLLIYGTFLDDIAPFCDEVGWKLRVSSCEDCRWVDQLSTVKWPKLKLHERQSSLHFSSQALKVWHACFWYSYLPSWPWWTQNSRPLSHPCFSSEMVAVIISHRAIEFQWENRLQHFLYLFAWHCKAKKQHHGYDDMTVATFSGCGPSMSAVPLVLPPVQLNTTCFQCSFRCWSRPALCWTCSLASSAKLRAKSWKSQDFSGFPVARAARIYSIYINLLFFEPKHAKADKQHYRTLL